MSNSSGQSPCLQTKFRRVSCASCCLTLSTRNSQVNQRPRP